MAGAIWVVLQHRAGEVHRPSLETVAAARRLAGLTGGEVEAILLGHQVGELAGTLAGRLGVVVRVADHAALADYTPGAYVGALEPAIRQAAPGYVLFPHTYQSMDYFPRLAQAVDGAIVPGIGALQGEEGGVVWTRPILGGKLQSDVRVKEGAGPIMVSVQSGSFPADGPGGGGEGRVEPLAGSFDGLAGDRELLGVEQAGEEEVDLSRAPVIVAAGRGVGGADKMGVIHELAAALGAEVGASRPVIDNGWLPRDRQIGSSGQTVAPKLYIAAGISGAIQHLVGMKASSFVVAINKDPNAPIFALADYGIVGDLHEVLPAMTAAIKEAKGG